MTGFYSALAQKIDTHFACGQTVMLWSDPGMGKTRFATETLGGRKEIHFPGMEKSGYVHTQVLIPASMDSGDLLGIPSLETLTANVSAIVNSPTPYNPKTMNSIITVPDSDGNMTMRSTEFATPSWALEANSYAAEGHVLILMDEFPAMSNAGQNIMLNILESRRLPNGFVLHPNVDIILAGNMNRSGVRGMTELTSAMTSRLAHYDMTPTLVDWTRGLSQGFGENLADYEPVVYTPEEIERNRAKARATVVSFLNSHPDMFNAGSAKIDRTRGWFNPRTWSKVIDVLTLSEGVDMQIRNDMVEALVGHEARTKFAAHVETLKLPTTEQIVRDPEILSDLDRASAFVSLTTLAAVKLNESEGFVREYAQKRGIDEDKARREVVREKSAPIWDFVRVINRAGEKIDNIAIGILADNYEKIYSFAGSRLLRSNPKDANQEVLDKRFEQQQKSLVGLFQSLNK